MKIKAIAGLFVAVLFTCLSQVNASPIEHFEKIAPPSNDDCANAIDLTVNTNLICGTITSGTLEDATASTAPFGCPGTDPSNMATYKAGDDVWYKFLATSNSHRITLSITGGSPTDLYHMVYEEGVTAGCSAMATFACSDPDENNLTGLTVGKTYFIRVFSNSIASGADTDFDICISTPPVVITNDDCASAIDISSLPFNQSYDATAATNNVGFITATGCADMNDGVWYMITGDGGDITITAAPTSWDAGIGIYTGTCGALTCVDDSNIGGMNVIEGITFASTNGVDYYVNVGFPSGTVDGSEGVFLLTATSSTLSIDKLLTKGFKYFPNPVTDILRLTANEAINEVSIYTILGRKIKHVQQSDLQSNLDLSNLTAGTYFVKAQIGDSSGTFKIIKQ